MAELTSEITLVPETSGKEVKDKVVEREGGVEDGAGPRSAENDSSPTPFVAGADPLVDKGALSISSTTTDVQQSKAPSRPSLVPLGSSQTSSSSLPAAPQPKRFSAVNINKKFLEKNTAPGASTSSSPASVGAKSGNTASRPPQPTSSHSRLVTTKLTGSPGISSVPAGWSRPSSVAPSPVPGNKSPRNSSPLPGAAPSTQLSTTVAPQLPHVGKVIQPQPRAAIAQLTSTKDSGPGKAWGNVKPVVSLRPDIQPDDFPTAAEVASVSVPRKPAKPDDSKAPAKAPSNQLKSDEVDTFRGVHLDPNAHHWGEEQDDDDDDNFLNGVIEFGDGRQYKVENSADSVDVTDQKETPGDPVSKDERFADDFDRSWPKSREPPPLSAPRDISTASTHSTSPKSHSAHSPLDSSRVLFNERSNRLEPYQSSYRPRQGSIGSKRGGLHEANGDMRGPRDAPHNVQVLQKPSGNEQARSRRFSNTSSGFTPSTPNGVHAGPIHREQRRDAPPPSPRMTRDLPPHHVDGGFGDHKGRRTSMGPPPVPPHVGHRDNGRQLPPHLSPNIVSRRLPSHNPHPPPPSDPPMSAGLSSSGRLPPHSPALSHTSLSTLSPLIGSHTQLPTPGVDLDEARKDVMHTAAERAKARRHQEEAEREAQKERARRKAAEIEEKMKAAKVVEAEKARQKAAEEASRTAQELEAIAMIEEAVKGVDLQLEPPPSVAPSPLQPYKTAPARRPSVTTRASSTTIPLTLASQADSWRGRPVPPQSPSVPKRVELHAQPPSTNFTTSGPSAVEQVASIADSSNGDLEVVDFSDMDKFVGVVEVVEEVEQIAQAIKPTLNAARPVRPSASDFFEETVTDTDIALTSAKKADYGAWRRKVEVSDTPNVALEPKSTVEPTVVPSPEIAPLAKEKLVPLVPVPPETPKKEAPKHDNSPSQVVQASISFNFQQRTPIRSQFREAPMSALDDTMSRIKGVLSGMQTLENVPKVVLPHGTGDLEGQHPLSPSKLPRERWVPPALRPRPLDEFDHPRESFLVTVEDFPSSPSHSLPVIRLPSLSHQRDVLPKPRLYAFHRPPHDRGLTILSVPGVSWKTLSMNDILFRGSPATIKGKFKYTVLLPGRFNSKSRGSLPSPRVNGAFGRPTTADGVSSWRKPFSTSTKRDPIEESPLEVGLDTQSRSPPPEVTPPQATVISVPRSSETSPSKSDAGSVVRRRSQPRMPEGSSVAFMRDSKIDVVTGSPKALVMNFIVGSELEDSVLSAADGMLEPGVITTSRVIHSPLASKPESKPDSTMTPTNGLVPLEEEPYKSSKTELTVISDASADHGLITPPSHAPGTWTTSSLSIPIKESPSRAPDPEHLKAVWSQSSKADVNAVNSLEAIPDDLTSLPFVMSETKQTEGSTPPLPSAPSRMSIRDVTKAFQQVPTSSSTVAQPSREKVPISPPTTNAPVARPTPTPSYSYSPLPQNNIRPAYGPYPSPMMTHSPAPVMYPHPMTASPVPSRMPVNGQQPMYNHSMWMAGPVPQAPGGVMRPVGPPYHPQMMAYPTPGYGPQPPHSHPGMMPPPTPPTQQAGRGRGMPLMSPVMSPAHAHPYGATPIVMHSPQNHGYMPMPAGRGQPHRPENGHMPPPQSHRPAQHTHSGFNPGPSSPYARPW